MCVDDREFPRLKKRKKQEEELDDWSEEPKKKPSGYDLEAPLDPLNQVALVLRAINRAT